MTATIRVLKATGIATVQDLGWPSGRAVGMPRSGAMDDEALRLGNALAGNDDGWAGIEWALGELILELGGPARFAVTGAAGRILLDGEPVEPWRTWHGRAGQRLALERPAAGRFGYFTVEGGIALPLTLGSRSTYLPTGLGGWQGRRLAPGDTLPLGDGVPGPPIGTPAARLGADAGPIRITAASQSHLFPTRSFELLASEPYRVSATSDRMGTRLDGPALEILTRASLPSEATCLGAIQVPDGGQPIVILGDGPTVGGYPKIGVVASTDLARFSQVAPGEPVRFRWVSVAEAQRAMRSRVEAIAAAVMAIRRLR